MFDVFQFDIAIGGGGGQKRKAEFESGGGGVHNYYKNVQYTAY